MKVTTIGFWGTALIILIAGAAGLAQSSPPVLELISVSSEEVQGDNSSGSDGFLNEIRISARLDRVTVDRSCIPNSTAHTGC